MCHIRPIEVACECLLDREADIGRRHNTSDCGFGESDGDTALAEVETRQSFDGCWWCRQEPLDSRDGLAADVRIVNAGPEQPAQHVKHSGYTSVGSP